MKTLKILNCITNEKFIDGLIETCEYTKGENTHDYVIFSKNNNKNLISKKEFVQIVSPDDFINYIKKNEYNVVVIHNLSSVPFYKIHEIPNNIKVVWFSWGFDIYTFPTIEHPLAKRRLYHEHTKKIIQEKIRPLSVVINSNLMTLIKWHDIKKNINRIDYYSGVLQEEYDLVNKNHFFKAKKIIFNYFSLTSDIKEENLNMPAPTGFNIQIGNSGDPSNNHIDIFLKLKKLGLTHTKLYVPLSYGGDNVYKENVIKYGKKLFGSDFIPILHFMPYKEYFEYMSSCSNVILGHERQQAIGNLIAGLWNGCKVFLSTTSVAYMHYRKHGYKIFTLQDDLSIVNLKSQLSKQDILSNRQALISESSVKANLTKLKEIYRILSKDIDQTKCE